LESVSGTGDRLYTILEIMGCEELVDKIISCRVSEQCPNGEFQDGFTRIKRPRSVIPNEIKISSTRIHLFHENSSISG